MNNLQNLYIIIIILLVKQRIGSQLCRLVLGPYIHTIEMRRIKKTFPKPMLNHFQNIQLTPERDFIWMIFCHLCSANCNSLFCLWAKCSAADQAAPPDCPGPVWPVSPAPAVMSSGPARPANILTWHGLNCRNTPDPGPLIVKESTLQKWRLSWTPMIFDTLQIPTLYPLKTGYLLVPVCSITKNTTTTGI